MSSETRTNRLAAVLAAGCLLPLWGMILADIAPDSLRLSRSMGDVHLQWGSGAGPYAVYRNTLPQPLAILSNQLVTTAALFYDDPFAALPSGLLYYLVGDLTECSNDSGCDDADPCNGFEKCDLFLGSCGLAPPLPRTTVDRPDDLLGPQVHLTYVLPSDAVDDQLDVSGQLEAEVRVAQRWLQEQTGTCIRFDTYQGSVDATFVQLDRTNEEIRTHALFVDRTLGLEFEGRGLDDPEKLYAVYYGGTTDSDQCGGGAGLGGGGPAVMFLSQVTSPGQPLTPCPFFDFVADANDNFRGHWAAVAIHETFHALGVVPTCAPDHFMGHLGTISSDLMAFNGTGFNVYTLDQARDQYFGHGDVSCLDLSNSVVWYAAPPQPDPIPGKVFWEDPVEVDCSMEPSSASQMGGAAATVRFVNTTDMVVRFYWLDVSGNRNPSVLLQPHSDFCCGSTSELHVYVAVDRQTGTCLGIFEMVPGANRIVIAD